MFDNFNFNFKEYKEKTLEFIQKNKGRFKAINTFLIRYFRWFTALVVIILLVIGFIFVLWPKYKEVTSLVRSSKQQQQEVFLQKQERLEDLQSIVESYENISDSQREKIEGVVPERRNREEVFTEIKNLVDRNNLSLKSISLEGEEEKEEEEREEDRVIVRRERAQEEKEKEEEEEDYKKRELPPGVERIRINIFVVGTNYNSLRSLLSTFENNLALVDIVNVGFNPDGKSTNLTLDTYQLK